MFVCSSTNDKNGKEARKEIEKYPAGYAVESKKWKKRRNGYFQCSTFDGWNNLRHISLLTIKRATLKISIFPIFSFFTNIIGNIYSVYVFSYFTSRRNTHNIREIEHTQSRLSNIRLIIYNNIIL